MADDAGTFQYDVAVSFAGEDRPLVEQVAALLSRSGVRVFYDEWEQASLWGKDLYQHLDEYILPVRLDDTERPGLPETIGYIDLRSVTVPELAQAVPGRKGNLDDSEAQVKKARHNGERHHIV